MDMRNIYSGVLLSLLTLAMTKSTLAGDPIRDDFRAASSTDIVDADGIPSHVAALQEFKEGEEKSRFKIEIDTENDLGIGGDLGVAPTLREATDINALTLCAPTYIRRLQDPGAPYTPLPEEASHLRDFLAASYDFRNIVSYLIGNSQASPQPSKSMELADAEEIFTPFMNAAGIPLEIQKERLEAIFSEKISFKYHTSNPLNQGVVNILNQQRVALENGYPKPEDFFSLHELADIYRMAKELKENYLDSAPGSLMLSLGNSPAYIGYRLKAMLSEDDQDRLIFVPYSGTAGYHGGQSMRAFTMLGSLRTTRRVEFLRNVWQERGLSPSMISPNQIVYVVDLGTTKAGVVSFLVNFIAWYREVRGAGIPLPNFKFINIKSERRLEPGAYSLPFYVSELGKFSVSLSTSFIFSNSNDLLIKFEGEGRERLEPHFNATHWTPSYREEMRHYPDPYAQELKGIVNAYSPPEEASAS